MVKQTIKVLLVEDHKLIQKATKMHFENAGSTVDVASNGLEAIDKANENKYDLIFMDIGLGDLDGYAVTKEIRDHSINASTPVIALTAHAYDDQQISAHVVKMNDYIVKPITSDLAKNIIRKYSSNSEENII